jgi:hypothetical protein
LNSGEYREMANERSVKEWFYSGEESKWVNKVSVKMGDGEEIETEIDIDP